MWKQGESTNSLVADRWRYSDVKLGEQWSGSKRGSAAVMGTFKSQKIKIFYKFILIFMGFMHGLNCQTSQNINVRKYSRPISQTNVAANEASVQHER